MPPNEADHLLVHLQRLQMSPFIINYPEQTPDSQPRTGLAGASSQLAAQERGSEGRVAVAGGGRAGERLGALGGRSGARTHGGAAAPRPPRHRAAADDADAAGSRQRAHPHSHTACRERHRMNGEEKGK